MTHPQRQRLLAPLAVFAPGLLLNPAARAQAAWPSQPIRLVVPFPPGGSSDLLGRLIADQLGKQLGASFFVDNRPGGTTQVGTEFVANSTPDGNTLILAASTAFTLLPNVRKVSFNVDTFEIAGGIADYMAVMAVRKTLPIKDIRQFVAYAKQNPGKLTFGSAGEASAGHIYGMSLANDTGIKVLHIPYKGSVAAVNSLVAGETDFIIDGAVTGMVKAGRVEPLGVISSRRHPELPQVPTLREAGLDVTMPRSAGWALAAPKGTPRAIMTRLSEGLRKVLELREVQEALARANSISAWQTPDEYRAAIATDRKMYAELLPIIGIKDI